MIKTMTTIQQHGNEKKNDKWQHQQWNNKINNKTTTSMMKQQHWQWNDKINDKQQQHKWWLRTYNDTNDDAMMLRMTQRCYGDRTTMTSDNDVKWGWQWQHKVRTTMTTWWWWQWQLWQWHLSDDAMTPHQRNNSNTTEALQWQQRLCSRDSNDAEGQQWCNGDSDVNRMVTVVTTMMLRPTPHQQPQWQWQNFNNRHKSKDNNNNKGNDKTNNDVKMTTTITKQHKCNRQQPQQSCQQWCNKCHKTAVPIRHQWWWQKWHNNVMANNNGMRSNNNDTMPT